ncbi:hypothetical protein [Dongia sp. agr-C8]
MSRQSAITLDKHTALDRAGAKAAIDAIKDRKHPMLSAPRVQARGKLRKKLGKELRPLFAGAGLDLGKLDNALKLNHAELKKSLAREQAANAKQYAQAHKQRLAGLANTRAALEQLAGIPHLTTNIPVPTPFFIGARPAGFLEDSSIAPFNNVAKPSLHVSQNTDGRSAKISFYFAWQNPIDFLAVLNCSADVIVNGHVKNLADDGIFTGGTARVKLRTELNIFVGPLTISFQQGQKADIDTISAEGGGIFDVGAVGDRDVVASTHLSAANIQVEGSRIAVFEVAFVADYSIDDGSIDIDFASGDRSVICPALNIELLTPPGPSVQPPFVLEPFTSVSGRTVR